MNSFAENFNQLITSKQQANHLIAGELLGTAIQWEQLPAPIQRRFVSDILMPLLQSSQDTTLSLQVWNWLKRDEDLLLFMLYEVEGGWLRTIFEKNPMALMTCVKANLHNYFKELVTSLLLWDDYTTDQLPAELFEWTALKALTLQSFPIETLPKALMQFPQLKRLHLVHCSLKQFPSWSLLHLEELSITSTYHLATMPETLDTWPHLKVLAIHESDVVVGPWILSFPVLEVLQLDYFNQLSDELHRLKYLREIHIEEELVDAPSLSEVDQYTDFWDRIESYKDRFPTITFHY